MNDHNQNVPTHVSYLSALEILPIPATHGMFDSHGMFDYVTVLAQMDRVSQDTVLNKHTCFHISTLEKWKIKQDYT